MLKGNTYIYIYIYSSKSDFLRPNEFTYMGPGSYFQVLLPFLRPARFLTRPPPPPSPPGLMPAPRWLKVACVGHTQRNHLRITEKKTSWRGVHVLSPQNPPKKKTTPQNQNTDLHLCPFRAECGQNPVSQHKTWRLWRSGVARSSGRRDHPAKTIARG